jgi:hypothetical protein
VTESVGGVLAWLSPAARVQAHPLHDYAVEPCHRPWDWDPSVLMRVQRAVAAEMESIHLQRYRTPEGVLMDAADRATFTAQRARMPLTKRPKLVVRTGPAVAQRWVRVMPVGGKGEQSTAGGVLCEHCLPLDQGETPRVFHLSRAHSHDKLTSWALTAGVQLQPRAGGRASGVHAAAGVPGVGLLRAGLAAPQPQRRGVHSTHQVGWSAHARRVDSRLPSTGRPGAAGGGHGCDV